MSLVFKKFIPAFLFLVFVTVLFCLPGSAFPDTNFGIWKFVQLDKLIHIIIFTLLVFLFCRPIQLKGFFTNILVKFYIVVGMVFIVYGIFIEIIQELFIKGRSFEALDILADTIGCFIGYFIAKKIAKKQVPPTSDELQSQLMDYAKGFVGKK